MSAALLTICVSLISSSHAYYNIDDFPPCISHDDCVAHPDQCWIEFANCKTKHDCTKKWKKEEDYSKKANKLCAKYKRKVSPKGYRTDCKKFVKTWAWVMGGERETKIVPDGIHVICAPLRHFSSFGIHKISVKAPEGGAAARGHNCNPNVDRTTKIYKTCITDTIASENIPAGGYPAVCAQWGRTFKAAFVASDAGSPSNCGFTIRCDSVPPGGADFAGEAYKNYLDYDMDNGQQDVHPHYDGYYGGYKVQQQSQFVMSALLIIGFVLCCLLWLLSNACVAGGCYFVGRKVLEAEANKNDQNV